MPQNSASNSGHQYSIDRRIKFLFTETPSGLNTWVGLYTGDLTYYEDRSLTVFTTYAYRLTVYNDFGFMNSEASESATTHGGQPQIPASLLVFTVSHTSLYANWTVPGKFPRFI